MFNEASLSCKCVHLKVHHWVQNDTEGVICMGGKCFSCSCSSFNLDNLKYLELMYIQKESQICQSNKIS